MKTLVTGAGGAVGGHLVKRLLDAGHEVRTADRKPLDEWWQLHEDATNIQADLWSRRDCRDLVNGINYVFHLAEDMGGIGHIETHRYECSVSVVPSINILMAAVADNVDRFFFSSSACIYPVDKQVESAVRALRESDAFPAMPELGYGENKLFFERICEYAAEGSGMQTHVGRYHNVYGPYGAWEGGREKAPAALCRKIAQAVLSGDHEIEIWGDGQQTRSFMFVDDCITGTLKVMMSDYAQPLNIGSKELISIDDLAYLIAGIAGIAITLRHNLSAPKGVRGRNSDNELIQQVLGWEPYTCLQDGLEKTYPWIYDQVKRQYNE